LVGRIANRPRPKPTNGHVAIGWRPVGDLWNLHVPELLDVDQGEQMYCPAL
jgi:hypothetical protein